VGVGTGSRRRVSVGSVDTFPLVPARRFAGVQFGSRRSPRRGPGDEVAGTRPYRPGDRRAWIDWRASAKLSAARGGDEFVVREFFAEQAPRVAVVADRGRSMSLYGDGFPWLDKAAALDVAVRLIARSTTAERGELAYVDQVGRRPLWLPPQRPARTLELRDRRRDGGGASSPAPLRTCLETLAHHAALFPHGSFVFVLSDFLRPPGARLWVRLRSLRWDVTPAVIQDPVWEQSFPDAGGVVLPLRDPTAEAEGDVWFSRREARERAAAHERRLESLLTRFARLGFDPVVLGTSDPEAIARCFQRWAARRQRLRQRRT
jgi:uncharacterized protein (DUF58 family)